MRSTRRIRATRDERSFALTMADATATVLMPSRVIAAFAGSTRAATCAC
jgi:hypothetical protein